MTVLVDTSVWSLALRRRSTSLSKQEEELCRLLGRLVTEDQVVMIGPIRQELLSGLREPKVFERLRERLRGFDDEPLSSEDFEEAARAHNRCRTAGIAGSSVDFLVCAVAIRRRLAVMTTDRDFRRYAPVLGLELYPTTETNH